MIKKKRINLFFNFLLRNPFSSIDKKEVETFSKVNDWWSDSSSMLPLEAYNYARVNYIRSFFDTSG